ncbi:TonB-dependent receptor [Paraburkholderia metrosideri]|uniref:TonB-dependent receptor n=1 Tax=Paraburkholderia metrosideri TaxID=580937 RepID=A0ABW9DQS1_9BURK
MKHRKEKNMFRASLGAAIFIACQVPLTCTSAFAQSTASVGTAVLDYNIQAGPLDRVLVAVATQSRRPISFDAAVTKNLRSLGVKGSLTAEQAVDKALLGTDLERVATGSGALTVRGKAEAATQSNVIQDAVPAAASLPQITVHDSAQPGSAGFIAPNSSSATRTDTPISELAQSVQVITKDVMRSQQTQSVEDVLSNVSGVTLNPIAATQDTVSIRGFVAPVSTDGLATNNGSNAAFQDGLSIPLIGIERIDVLKGADSILAGAMDPGGVVNVVRKQPQADPVHEITLQTGSYGEMLAGADLAGALTKDQHLTYRFIVSGERTGESYGGSIGKRSLYVAPSIGYKTADTDFVVGFEQNTQHSPIPLYTMIVNGSPAHLSYPIGNADDHVRLNSSTVYYSLSQKLSSNWTFTSKASYNASVQSFFDNATTELDDSGDAAFIPVAGSEHQRTLSLEESVQGKFKTGPVSHTLLGGFSFQRTVLTNGSGADADGIALGSIFSTVLPEVNVPTQASVRLTDYSNQVYLQDQISVFQRLHILASISHAQDRNADQSSGASSADAWNPNIGILYQLTGNLGVYANYLRSFTPQGVDLLADGSGAPPSRGKQVEVGLKGNFLEDRLTASVALFRAAATNQVTQDSSNPNINTINPAGTVSRGVEFDVSGELLKGWNVIANYSYTAQQSAAPTTTYSSLPRHLFRLWTTYALQGEALHGFGIGGGITVRSSYLGQQTGDVAFTVPGQASTDLSVFYRGKNWSTTFGVKNVFDHRLYGDTATNSFLAVYPGRTFLLTGTYAF